MTGRALLCAFSPKPNIPPDTSLTRRSFGSDFESRTPFRSRVRINCWEHCFFFRVSEKRRRRRCGKVWADVKSERYEISDSVPESVKLKERIDDVVRVEEDSEGSGPWWEQFPKRWVIVVLCFSAFLLCNMDRVSFCFYGFVYIQNAGLLLRIWFKPFIKVLVFNFFSFFLSVFGCF